MIRTTLAALALLSGLGTTSTWAQDSADMTLDICPNNFTNFPMDISGLRCTCSAEQAKADATIWGANPYDSGSDICRAAVHAGAITTAGGQVRIAPAIGVKVFPSVTSKDIRSASSGAGDGYKVDASPDASGSTDTAPIRPVIAPTYTCPNNLINFPTDSPPLSCTCSTERAKADATIWGANPYDNGSDICRAAVHAGAISTNGGEIKVTSVTAVPVFPSVTRNGIRSASSGAGDGYTIAAGPNAASAITTVEVTAEGMALDVCPNSFINFPTDGPALTCACSSEQAKADATIWGANPYDAGSDICRAAVHAGAITTSGGEVKVISATKIGVFPSVTRNGVRSASSGPGDGYTVAAASGAAMAVAPIRSTEAGIVLDICPNSYINFPMDSPPLTCACSSEQAKADATIWGANPYDAGSDICRAAVHAGAITTSGGEVKVTSATKIGVFPSVTRNGVRSASSGPGDGYTVAAASGAAMAVAPIRSTEAGIVLDICPNSYINFPMDSPPLTCACSSEQAKADATIWGTNPYDAGSDICRAAVHAGAITNNGGEVKITPSPGVLVFPSVTRNDVRSASANGGDGYTVEVMKKALAPAVDADGPVQAPIAATLKATGRVQLYINFATDKAEPLPSSAPILAELLNTLRDDTALKLDLIGHTDSQGGADYNLDLSQRRAASVYLFLVQSGIQPERLRASERGLMEPIAANSTVEGRALNRRVEARQVQ